MQIRRSSPRGVIATRTLLTGLPFCAREACAPAYRLKGDATCINVVKNRKFLIHKAVNISCSVHEIAHSHIEYGSWTPPEN